MTPLRTALLAQLFGGLIAVAAIQLAQPKLFALPAACALIQGAFAAFISHKLEAPRWWIPIHIAFLPLAITASRLGIPSLVWFGGFLLLFLLFWRTDKSQVPLYMTNSRAALAVAALLPPRPICCIDLGCGTGSLLKCLALARPESSFTGIEHAPLPFLLAWARSISIPNLTIRYGDFWCEDLGRYEVVYAFLSPVPMTRLWQKSRTEMLPDSILISNSFEIPNIEEKQMVEVADRRRTKLFIYLQQAEKQETHLAPFPDVIPSIDSTLIRE